MDELRRLLERIAVANGVLLLSAAELSQWPSTTVAAMKAERLLTRARPAVSATCGGCDRQCTMPVHILGSEPRWHAFIACDKRSDISRVPVPADQLEQWQILADSIASLLARQLGLYRPTTTAVDASRWEVGLLKGAKHRSHVVLFAEGELWLSLAGHSIAVADVLELRAGRFSVDRRQLVDAVDHPCAQGGDRQSAERRRARIEARIQELRLRRVKGFLKVVAAEEGVGVPRIKQLMQKKPTSPPGKVSVSRTRKRDKDNY